MNKYDTIKEVFEWPLLEDFDASRFYKIQSSRGRHFLECKPQPPIPGLNRITIDETAGKDEQGEVTIEYSAKILGARYPELLSLGTIELAHANIVRTGIISFDATRVLANAQALKIHQTADLRLSEPLSTYGRTIRQLWVPNGYQLHNDARGKDAWRSFHFKRDIQANPEYLKLYDKFREFNLARNREFRQQFTQAKDNELLRHFQGITRAEFCLSGKKKIKQHLLDVGPEVLLMDVLKSKVNALGNLVTKLTAELAANDSNCLTLDFAAGITNPSDYKMLGVLALAGYDFEALCENLKARYKDSTFYALKPQYEALLIRYLSHENEGQAQALLTELQTAVASVEAQESLWYDDSLLFSGLPHALAA